jgi:hypothetical protein
MATQLTKNLVRESLEKFDDREIMVTLKEDQKIALKLKGMKSGEVSIGILELYKQLADVSEPSEKESKPSGPIVTKTTSVKATKGNPLINTKEFLSNLRSMNAISTLDVPTMVKFDAIIQEAMAVTEKRYKNG